MRHYKSIQKTIEQQVLTKITCDKCGNRVEESSTGYNTKEFRLEMLTGSSCPDGGYHEGWKIDLCNGCVEWLKIVLKENGVALQEVYNDW